MIKVFMLFAVITSNQGHESLVAVDKVEYKDKFSCLLNKAQYEDSNSIKFFCAEKDLYFNNQQKLF